MANRNRDADAYTCRRYSPSALSKPRAEVAECARQLGEEQKAVTAEAARARDEAFAGVRGAHESRLLDVHLKGDELTFYTTLTLIYRAIPAPEGSPSSFAADCVDAARVAMRIHHECMDMMGSNTYLHAIYIHWYVEARKDGGCPVTISRSPHTRHGGQIRDRDLTGQAGRYS